MALLECPPDAGLDGGSPFDAPPRRRYWTMPGLPGSTRHALIRWSASRSRSAETTRSPSRPAMAARTTYGRVLSHAGAAADWRALLTKAIDEKIDDCARRRARCCCRKTRGNAQNLPSHLRRQIRSRTATCQGFSACPPHMRAVRSIEDVPGRPVDDIVRSRWLTNWHELGQVASARSPWLGSPR